jgi:methionine-rich copper-binding protein CopC
MPPLAPGRWRVQWQVLSTDGHVVSGRYEFQLAP